MNRSEWRRAVAVGLCLGLAWTVAAARELAPRGRVLLVVPARLRVLQVARDMVALRGVDLIACRGGPQTADPLLFAWRHNAWQPVTPDDYRDGRFAEVMPRHVVVVGDDTVLPPLVARESGWGVEPTRLTSLQTADLINGLDLVLEFSRREWKWLAGRYGLTLSDLNEPRRRENPFAVPRSRQPLPAESFPARSDDLPPAVLIQPGAPAPAGPVPVAPEDMPVLPPDAAPAPAEPPLK